MKNCAIEAVSLLECSSVINSCFRDIGVLADLKHKSALAGRMSARDCLKNLITDF